VTSGDNDKWPFPATRNLGVPLQFPVKLLRDLFRQKDGIRPQVRTTHSVGLGGSPTQGASGPATSVGTSPTPLFVTSYHALSTEEEQRSLSHLQPVLSLRTCGYLHPPPQLFH